MYFVHDPITTIITEETFLQDFLAILLLLHTCNIQTDIFNYTQWCRPALWCFKYLEIFVIIFIALNEIKNTIYKMRF